MNISKRIILNGEGFFHPRATIIKDKLLMTMQTINGSDHFGPVQYFFSNDKGKNWTNPGLLCSMGRIPVSNEIEEGVCDVVPDYHSHTETVLAIGHNVYYKEGKLYDSLADWKKEDGPVLQRYIVYNVMDKHGRWSGLRKRLEYQEFTDCSMFSCGCSQKVVLTNGNILIPITFGEFDRKDRQVCSLLCSFDGNLLTPLKRGNILENPVKRGLLEPSIVEYQDRFYMTMRAEDERGYLSISNDGLSWQPIKSWQWDNGIPLTTSTTQQHWLKLNKKLYLIYTRKTKENADVTRWRAPVFIAEVDTQKLCLKRDTEQIVLPMRGNLANPDTIALMGNFHPLALSKTEAIVTVGEMLPQAGWKGDTLIAYIKSQ